MQDAPSQVPDRETRSPDEIFRMVEADLRSVDTDFQWTHATRAKAEHWIHSALIVARISSEAACSFLAHFRDGNAALTNTLAEVGRPVGIGRAVLARHQVVQHFNHETRILHALYRVLSGTSSDEMPSNGAPEELPS